MPARVVITRVLAHAHEHSSLLELQVGWGGVKIHLGCGLNTHGIIQKIKLIEIHRNDLVFRIELLQLSRNHPFVGFLHQSLNRASSGR